MAKEVLTEERHKNDHHHHEESCGCGHDHHHEDACGCGHDHHHEDACGCGHEHHHEEHKEADHTFDHAEKQVYILENLGCAHCASKMEEKDSGTASGRVCCNYLRDKTTAGCDEYGCGAVRGVSENLCVH